MKLFYIYVSLDFLFFFYLFSFYFSSSRWHHHFKQMKISLYKNVSNNKYGNMIWDIERWDKESWQIQKGKRQKGLRKMLCLISCNIHTSTQRRTGSWPSQSNISFNLRLFLSLYISTFDIIIFFISFYVKNDV